MPTYCYSCSDCSKKFEVRHSMSFEEQLCVHCNSERVFRVPSLGRTIKEGDFQSRTGKIVDDYIKDAKREVEIEKDNMKREVK